MTGRKDTGMKSRTDTRIKNNTRISTNNNRPSVRRLALRSVKSSRMRNVFVVLAIALSASLLMVMALFMAGTYTGSRRQAEGMQHAVYYGISGEQLLEMAEDSSSTYVLGMKQGQSVEIDGEMLTPTSYGREPMKAENGESIITADIVKGEFPDGLDEIMLADTYCEKAGITAEVGETVSFTWLDGRTENYVISGIYHGEKNQPVYNVYFSEDYAREGSQLKDVKWQGLVRLRDAAGMNQQEFEDAVYSFGEEHGVVRKNININNYMLRLLPGGVEQIQETLLILGAGVGILFVSVLVIYSVFYLSVVGRVRQFGQLRAIGMTKKQIRQMVRIEGVALSSVGIPAGLMIGGIVGYFIRPDGWSWMNTLLIAAAVTLAVLVTVMISVRKPAKIAALVSPVEAVRYSGYVRENAVGKHGKIKSGKNSFGFARKLTPGSLAVMSVSRNRKKTALTVLSLGIGGVLYMMASFWVTSTSLEEYARTGEYQFGEFIVSYSYNVAATAEHGEMDLQAAHPIDEAVTEAVRSIDGVEEIHDIQAVEMQWEGRGDNGTDTVAPLTKERAEQLEATEHKGEISYDRLAEERGLIVSRGGTWEEVYGWEFVPGDEIKLSWYDGEKEQEQVFTVMAVIDKDDFNVEPGDTGTEFLLADKVLREMLGDLDLTEELVLRTDREREDTTGDQLEELIEEYPYLSMASLSEHMQEVESMWTIVFSVFIGLSLFIIGFAMLNLLNTLITNILTRDHEFAMLQSVGMTKKQLSRMLRLEGLVLAGGNLLITLTAGTAAGYVMIGILRHFGAQYMHFSFPVWFFLGYAVFILAVPVLVTEYMVRRFQRQTLVDRLRQSTAG